jgi:hypothetical protein
MKSLKNSTSLSVAVVVILTVIAEFPGVNHWIDDVMSSHGHVAVLVEGIIGVILILFSGLKQKPNDKDHKTEPQRGSQK